MTSAIRQARSAAKINRIAAVAEASRSPVDWSFRTEGTGRTGPGNDSDCN